ncbi:MAG TPA: hypothetical protein VED40_01045 [Azospirillaceae bacterium]|nr:hypothetical protein [Azospirillaceae bacterium]
MFDDLNARVRSLLRQALATCSPSERERLVQEAMELKAAVGPDAAAEPQARRRRGWTSADRVRRLPRLPRADRPPALARARG